MGRTLAFGIIQHTAGQISHRERAHGKAGIVEHRIDLRWGRVFVDPFDRLCLALAQVGLPTKPSRTPTSTPTLPMRLHRLMTVAITPSELASPRTSSSRLMTLAGEKKCMPVTSRGRDVDTAISLISSAEVLVARIAPCLQTRSS